MAVTPKKLVHWQFDSPSFSNLNSPFFDGTSESSMVSTSSLEYVNAQLVAHGFAPSPGLSLDGISNDDSARVVKCLLGMLGQRVDDMSRTEDLTTKYRTLSYDHERMRSMYRTATEKAANAEREMNLHKSRLTASIKSLQSSENAHKQTTAELQRTRTLLQGVRATHQAELKKKDKEVERVMEKWQKVADSQAKVTSAQSGMRCANVVIVDGAEVLGKGQGFLDVALEQAEQARNHLSDENLFLRKLVLRTLNEVQSALYKAQCMLPGDRIMEEPIPLTLTTLFPMAPPTLASEKLESVITTLRETLTSLSQPQPQSANITEANTSPQVTEGEIERLQVVITKLKEELACSQKQSMAHVVETQAMFDKFAEDHRIATGEIGEISMELMTAPLKDAEKERLISLRKELDMERQKFTDAAVRFGKEKAALEAERAKFLDDKRSWEVEKMLADLPPTPLPVSPQKPKLKGFKMSPKKSPHKSPHKSPRRSPAKNISVGKVGSGRKVHRVSRRSLASPAKVISYETEFMPPLPAPTFLSMKPLAPSSSLLPTSFVLPPPSPRASLPTRPALPPRLSHSPQEIKSKPSDAPDYSPPTLEVSPPPEEAAIYNYPSTPGAVRRSFPVAKPFAQRMIHAYSPAKPSPLSRILQLADSPLTPSNNFLFADASLSPTSRPLEAVLEEDSEAVVLGIPFGAGHHLYQEPPPRARTPEPQMSLAAELGVSESPPDTPLQEKKVEPNVVAAAFVVPPRGGRVFFTEPNAAKKQQTAGYTATEKGKFKAEPPRAQTSAGAEKENSNLKQKTLSVKVGVASAGAGTIAVRKVSPTGAIGGKPVTKVTVKSVAPTAAAGARAKPPPKQSIAGGPRRVPINSADAPTLGKGWKG